MGFAVKDPVKQIEFINGNLVLRTQEIKQKSDNLFDVKRQYYKISMRWVFLA